MSLKKAFGKNVAVGVVAAGAALCMCAFSACSNGAETPCGSDGDVSAVDTAEETVESAAEEATGETAEEDAAEVAKSPAQEPGEGEAESSSNEDLSSSSFEIPESMQAYLDTADTARHEPDSVGVWHFYDARGTHDNPDFAYGEMTDPRDGMVYKTTTIGGKVWMAENLNYFDIEGAANSIKNDWCYWDKSENCESAGRLYTWKVAQRICPEGWRLPTKSDWESLLQEVGADSLNEILWKGSSKLKSLSGWENEGSGTDDFGFTALPAGMKFTTSTQDGFTYHGCSSLMWAATEADGGAADSLAYHMYLDCSNDNAIVNTVRKVNGLSVRCVKE